MIEIAQSRQLFIDSFLIDDEEVLATTGGAATTSSGPVGIQRVFHQAEVSPTPVLSPDCPWESESSNPTVQSTIRLPGMGAWQSAMAFSGGAWYDPRPVAAAALTTPPPPPGASGSGLVERFKIFYECGINNAVCLATSADGISFTKPRLRPDGSNKVVDQPHDGTSVHLVLDEEDPSRRFQMTMAPVQFCKSNNKNITADNATMVPYICDNSGNGCSRDGAGNGPAGSCQHLKASADGIHWRTIINKTGTSGDRSTGFYNALRKKYVWSIRPGCIPAGSKPSGRWRGYVEGDSFESAANWDNCTAGICEPPTAACTSGRVRGALLCMNHTFVSAVVLMAC